MKITTSLFALLLLVSASATALATPLTPEQQAQVDTLKKCTPTDEASLLKILDKTQSDPSCWTKDAYGKDQVIVYLLDLSDVGNDSVTKNPLKISLTKTLVLPDGAILTQLGGLVPPAQFTADFVDPNSNECAVVVGNRTEIGILVDKVNPKNTIAAGKLSILPGIPTDPTAFPHKITAMCIKGSQNAIASLTVGTNNNHSFINGIIIDGKSNFIALSTLTTLTNGIVLKQGGQYDTNPKDKIDDSIPPNIIAQNTITTVNDNCVGMKNGQCTGYLKTGGIVIDSKELNSFFENTLTKGTNVYFGYDDTTDPITPYWKMEEAANALTLNKLPVDNTRSNYVELYQKLSEKDLPECPAVTLDNINVRYQYFLSHVPDGNGGFTDKYDLACIATKVPNCPSLKYQYFLAHKPVGNGNFIGQYQIVCADGSTINPACPAVNKVTGKCACADAVCGDKSCPAGTKLSDGNICIPDKASNSCPDGFIDSTGKCSTGKADPSKNQLCGTGNYILLGGKCGTSCGKNQFALNGKCQCLVGYMADPSDTANCITDPSFNASLPPTSGSGGGSCTLSTTATAASPVAAFLIVIALTGLSALRLRPKAVRVKSQRRHHE